MQRQKGGDDCGLFALANLVEVMHGQDPRKARYDKSKMRAHVYSCLTMQRWEAFPKHAVSVQRVQEKDETYRIKVIGIGVLEIAGQYSPIN